MCSIWKTEMKAVKRDKWFAQKHPSFILKAGKPEDFFGSLADYRLISLNVALKAVAQQQTEGMLMNLND